MSFVKGQDREFEFIKQENNKLFEQVKELEVELEKTKNENLNATMDINEELHQSMQHIEDL